MHNNILIDQFGRKHDYLRISLTDKCNLRCQYCMPEGGLHFMPNTALMTKEEVLTLAGVFVEMGVKKIRLTGGEPLVRPDIEGILSGLEKLPVELTITSNGLLIDRYFEILRSAGISTLNISLDSLKEERFRQVTRRDYLHKVMRNIHLALEKGFRVKVNSVVMKNVNEEELLDFAAWTIRTAVDIRFIEYMPFSGNEWEFEKVVSYQQMLTLLCSRYEMEKLEDEAHATSRAFRIKGAKGTLGIISSVTHPFCEGCNRIRLTADGKLKNCLFSTGETDLLGALRRGEDYRTLILDNISGKHFSRGGLKGFEMKGAREDYEKNRSMISIGG